MRPVMEGHVSSKRELPRLFLPSLGIRNQTTMTPGNRFGTFVLGACLSHGPVPRC